LPPARTHFCEVDGAVVVAVLDPGEQVLELHHARIGEHQRRVVARHQRRGRHDLVAVASRKVRKVERMSFRLGIWVLCVRGAQ
jgi:hypothetical protein